MAFFIRLAVALLLNPAAAIPPLVRRDTETSPSHRQALSDGLNPAAAIPPLIRRDTETSPSHDLLDDVLGLLPLYTPGEDGTYSQNYQDIWLTALAKYNNWTSKPGFFLDFGAYKGFECSNSALLEKSLGWNGICVEPFPDGFDERSCSLVTRALSDSDGQYVQFKGADQERKIDSTSAVPLESRSSATITAQTLLECVNGTAFQSSCQGVGKRLKVPAFVNFASLDVEGNEAKVLQHFPWQTVSVGAWVIENNVHTNMRTPTQQNAVREIMKSNGYLHVPVENAGVDEYFVLPQFWHASLASKPRREHPLGSNGC